MTCGVPQGSVLGLLLWNVVFNGVFELELPVGVRIVGYADDLAIVVSARKHDQVTAMIRDTVQEVTSWIDSTRLTVATEKTEAVMLTGRRRVDPVRITMGDTEVRAGECLKYLGVWLDRSLRFGTHVRKNGRKGGEVGLCDDEDHA